MCRTNWDFIKELQAVQEGQYFLFNILYASLAYSYVRCRLTSVYLLMPGGSKQVEELLKKPQRMHK
jgi:hypothetical protein